MGDVRAAGVRAARNGTSDQGLLRDETRVICRRWSLSPGMFGSSCPDDLVRRDQGLAAWDMEADRVPWGGSDAAEGPYRLRGRSV